jgi:hypothetical protein
MWFGDDMPQLQPTMALARRAATGNPGQWMRELAKT